MREDKEARDSPFLSHVEMFSSLPYKMKEVIVTAARTGIWRRIRKQDTEPMSVPCQGAFTPSPRDERSDSNDSEDRDTRDNRVPSVPYFCPMSGCQEWNIYTSKIVIILEMFEATWIQWKYCWSGLRRGAHSYSIPPYKHKIMTLALMWQTRSENPRTRQRWLRTIYK